MQDRIEANINALLLDMGRAGGGVQRDDALATWTVGGSPISYHNAMLGCRATTLGEVAQLVAAFTAELLTSGASGSWHLSPSMSPAGLAGLLLDAGFTGGDVEPAMAASLDGVTAIAVDGLDISVVDSAAGFADYEAVLADGFGEGPPEAAWVHEVFSSMAPDPDMIHLVGRVDGEPAATASALVTGDTVGIYFVATRPAFRGRGFGTALTTGAMAAGADRGAAVAVLGTSPMGHSLYRRLGFEDVFEYRIFGWEPPYYD